MVNKRGWMRVAEACIAILIVLAMLLILNRTRVSEGPADLTTTIPPILDEIARIESFRQKIISEDSGIQTELDTFVKGRLPQLGVEFKLLICATTDPCTLVSPPTKDVYTDERIIGSALADSHSNPKRLRLFVWR